MELNVPNRLTILRLFMALGLFAVLTAIAHDIIPRSSIWLCLAAGLFLLCAATDFLDGYLARKWRLVTGFGRVADPFADKILICGALILLIELSPLIPAWFVVLVVIRELGITALRGQLEGRGLVFGAGPWGKAKMLSQCLLVSMVLLYEAFREDMPVAAWYAIALLLAITLFLTLASGLIYLRQAYVQNP